jgi:hypothetical protein
MGQMRYSVYFTPLEDIESNTYADEIDVSDKIILSGIGSIRSSIDSSDYDIGLFVFSDLELTGLNASGYFNESQDTRSIFRNTRDRCKVRIVFENREMVRNSSGTVLSETVTDTVTFRGLLNEEATRLDVIREKIRFKILSRDSVLRTTKISAGVITDSMTFSDAFAAILDVPRITSVLNFDAADINPALDLPIDVGSWFNNKSVKEGLDKLLFAANSVLLINDDGDMIIRSRAHDEDTSIVNLYGKNDIHRRENMIDITAYNTGRQRMFNSIVINGIEANNADFVSTFGLRQKSFTLPFITDNDNEELIAETIVEEFKTPKIELNVKIATHLARTIELLDRVSVNYPLRLEPPEGTFLPVIGVTAIDDEWMPLPYTFGAIEIPDRLGFKVIEIEHNPEKFTSILKLRQIGTGLSDGVLDPPNNCIVGYAVIDSGVICEGGDACDTYNPSVIGAALIDCTEVA